ncbi:HAD-IA family hydrolase [Streptomyces tsukubensis]|uniref:HAD-IA family hydrolase n=1 Tax=Streptomyces tsukubensis TaxID=83656 RepID=UPI00369F52FB
MVYSHECGLLKPDPDTYAYVCKRLRIRPEDCLFVDDVAENVRVAGIAGMRAVLHHSNAGTTAAITTHASGDPGPGR